MTLTKYSLWTISNSLKIFYIIYLSIVAFMIATFAIATTDTFKGTYNGSETSVYVYVFITGIVFFVETFKVAMANSFTRKNVFRAAVTVGGALAVFAAVSNSIIMLISNMFLDSRGMFLIVYYSKDGANAINFSNMLTSALWDICLITMLFAIGFIIGLLYYKLSKIGRILLSFTAFGIPFFIFPMLDGILADGKTIAKVFEAVLFCLGLKGTPNPFIAMITFLCIAAVAFGGSYFLIRRLPIKKAG